MLVHFPAALFPFGVIMDVLSFAVGDFSFAAAACYSYAGGVVFGCVAAVFGAMDYFRIQPEQRMWKIASIHGLLNLVWISAFTFIVGVRISEFPHFAPPTTVQLVTTAVCVLSMIVSNHLGGELVLRYGLGMSHRNSD